MEGRHYLAVAVGAGLIWLATATASEVVALAAVIVGGSAFIYGISANG